MAATLAARRLTEAHRLAQHRLGVRTVALALDAFALLDVSDLDRTMPGYLRTMTALVAANRRTSATLAANYLRTFRSLELGLDGGGRFVPVVDDELDARALATSLTVTGPASLRRNLARGVDFDRAVEIAKSSTARAAMRHVLAGGRGTVTKTVRADRRALGYGRVASGSACAFCAMLASRGPVYKSEDTADFEAHDGCSCGVEPVYREDAAWAPGARRYARMWDEAKAAAAESGEDTRLVFRRLVEARSTPG